MVFGGSLVLVLSGFVCSDLVFCLFFSFFLVLLVSWFGFLCAWLRAFVSETVVNINVFIKN